MGVRDNHNKVSSPQVANGSVYAGSNSNSVYALNTTDGSERWRFKTVQFVYSSPAVANATVYIPPNTSDVYTLRTGPNQAESLEYDSITLGIGASVTGVILTLAAAVNWYRGSRDDTASPLGQDVPPTEEVPPEDTQQQSTENAG